ncbi:MAG: isochorismatase family protein, partial [Clostridia bacterium]|nr:isochorismatase family protein [Clostridia bacterium]
MQNILLVIDMQTDFVDGVLGTKEACAIVPAVREKILGHTGKVYFTRDTHEPDYMDTREGKRLPVPHCIRGTEGWQIIPA